MPSKRVGDALKKNKTLQSHWSCNRYSAGSQAASYKSRKNKASRNTTQELEEGQERKLTALLFVKLRTVRALTFDSKFYTLSSYNRTKLQDLL